MHLPRWRAPAGASRALRTAWESYVAALEHHERGHVLLALEAGRAVRAALRAMGAHADEDAVHAAAWVASGAALDDVRERERRYDAETRDGEAHGACLAALAADE